MPKKMKPLSTASEQMRYLISSPRSAASSSVAAGVLLLLLAGAGPGRAQAAEEPLSPEFIDYLATVEGSGIKWAESMTLEEIYQMLKKLVQEPPATRKKDSNSNGRDEHGDKPKK